LTFGLAEVVVYRRARLLIDHGISRAMTLDELPLAGEQPAEDEQESYACSQNVILSLS
jgi:hypothetical protein